MYIYSYIYLHVYIYPFVFFLHGNLYDELCMDVCIFHVSLLKLNQGTWIAIHMSRIFPNGSIKMRMFYQLVVLKQPTLMVFPLFTGTYSVGGNFIIRSKPYFKERGA